MRNIKSGRNTEQITPQQAERTQPEHVKPQQAERIQPEQENSQTKKYIQMKLLSPLSGIHFLKDSQGWRHYVGDREGDLNGKDLARYEEAIKKQVDRENQPEIPGGDPFDPMEDEFLSLPLREKTVRAGISVEKIKDVLYGCTTLLLKAPLTPRELEELYGHLTIQYSDGWGDSLEQTDIRVEDGFINVRFCDTWDIDFFLQTNEVEAPTPERRKRPAPADQKPIPPDPGKPRLKLQVRLQEGNIFSVLPDAIQLLNRHGRREEAQGLYHRVTETGNRFQEALAIIREYVEIEPVSARKTGNLKEQKTKGKKTEGKKTKQTKEQGR